MTKILGKGMLSNCVSASIFQQSTRQDNPQITDVIAKVALDGQTISISGRCNVEDADVEVFNADNADNPVNHGWSGFAHVTNGVFSNDAMPARLTHSDTVLTLRLRIGNDTEPEIEFRTLPLTGAINAEWTANGTVSVSGQGTPVNALVLANTVDRGLVPIADVLASREFANTNLPASFLWEEDTLQICLRNRDNESDPASELINVPVKKSLLLSDVEAEQNANGTITLRATVTGKDEIIDVCVKSGSDNNWHSVGHVQAGNIELSGISQELLWNTSTLRVQLQAGTMLSTSVDATLGWYQSRAFYVKASLDPQIERLRLQQSMPASDLQPTGYYAKKGDAFTVFLTSSTANVEILIGTPFLAQPENPNEDPPAPRCHRLKAGENKIPADQFGGAIHIRYLQTLAGAPPPNAHIVLGETTQAIAYYRDGLTTIQQWKRMINTPEAPVEAQLVSNRLVIIGLREELIAWQDEDPHAVLAAHHALLDVENDIAGLDSSSDLHAPSQLRLYAVRSRNNFNPRAFGGGIAIPGTFQEQLFTRHVQESWMLAHEYGHHKQLMWDDNSAITLSEVVVNIYSLAAWRKYGGEPDETIRLGAPENWGPIQKYLALPREEKTYTEYLGEDGQPIPFMSMAPFDQIRRGLGSNFIRNWHKKQRENPLTEYTRFAFKKAMILNACRAAELNLTDFFADWGILKEDEADRSIWEEANALAFESPSTDMTAIPVYVRNDPDDEWLELSDVTVEILPDAKASVRGHCAHEEAYIGIYSVDEDKWLDIGNVKDGEFENLAVPASYFSERRSLKLRGVIAGLHSVEARFPIQPQFTSATAKWNTAGLIELHGVARPAYATVVAQTKNGLYPIATIQANGNFQNLNLHKNYRWEENMLRLWIRNGEGIFEPTVGPFDVPVTPA